MLFVDDDLAFLDMIERSFKSWSDGGVAIDLAHSAGQAISLLQQHTFDVAVLDIRMPVVDGLQFLHLLQRKHPNVRKVVLTGYAEQAFRSACLKGGAELFLEKPRIAADFDSVFAAVGELLRAPGEDGFNGTIRSIGLHEILQLECLARRSSVLEVAANGPQGRIYIKEGAIAHAESGTLSGHDAFYFLMSLRGGTFSLSEYTQPATETIQGPWEFLLMESSRMRDEGCVADSAEAAPESLIPDVPMGAFATPAKSPPNTAPAPQKKQEKPPVPELSKVTLQECVVVGGNGDVSLDFQSEDPELRANFLKFLRLKSRQISQGLNLGAFRQFEAHTVRETVVAECRIHGGLYARCKPEVANAELVFAEARIVLSN
jgi:ActR/RegA family two-component response regulator